MRNKVYELFKALPANKTNYVVYYEKNKRVVKTFAELSADIDTCIRQLGALDLPRKTVALCGPTSYAWMVADLACMKGGYHSIAIPETFDEQQMATVLADADVLLADYAVKDRCAATIPHYYLNCDHTVANAWHSLAATGLLPQENVVQMQYGTAFTSGTSDKTKKITLAFPVHKTPANKSLLARLKLLGQLYAYKTSFWSRKDNKLIIFMPFSHLQQRTFVLYALFRKINIVLSGPADCIRHIITEKPNIMVSVPVFYEVLAKRIDEKLQKITGQRKRYMQLYHQLGIHRLSNRNLVKKLWSKALFKDIQKVYGGRADYFITGSAPIDRQVLETFYSIGVKIYEAYGQSETAILAINTEKHFRIGSVGKPGTDVKISDESEVLLKYDEEKFGRNQHILEVKDGYIHTGDAGYIDQDGFLFLQGRIDDVVVLGNGKKIFPGHIEQQLRKHEAIRHAVVFLHEHKLAAILDVDTRKLAGNLTVEDLIRNVNLQGAAYEQIGHYFLVQVPFTPENGMLTGSLKVRRKKVIEQYHLQPFLPL